MIKIAVMWRPDPQIDEQLSFAFVQHSKWWAGNTKAIDEFKIAGKDLRWLVENSTVF